MKKVKKVEIKYKLSPKGRELKIDGKRVDFETIEITTEIDHSEVSELLKPRRHEWSFEYDGPLTAWYNPEPEKRSEVSPVKRRKPTARRKPVLDKKPMYIISFSSRLPRGYDLEANLPDDFDEGKLKDGMTLTMKDGRKGSVGKI